MLSPLNCNHGIVKSMQSLLISCWGSEKKHTDANLFFSFNKLVSLANQYRNIDTITTNPSQVFHLLSPLLICDRYLYAYLNELLVTSR